MQPRYTAKVILTVFSILLLSFNLISTSSANFNKDLVLSVSKQFQIETQCLAENVYYESASESYEGKLAVAQVTLNRAKSGNYPKNICDVVHQRNEHTCQFTWVCEKHYSVRDKYQWEESMIVAKKAMTEVSVHDTLYQQNAIYYHADYVDPGWKKVRITKIGRHIFYK
jgi:spore germination cell wall hydrolase CwlJ-like protein